jgi:hypothetical protein
MPASVGAEELLGNRPEGKRSSQGVSGVTFQRPTWHESKTSRLSPDHPAHPLRLVDALFILWKQLSESTY